MFSCVLVQRRTTIPFQESERVVLVLMLIFVSDAVGRLKMRSFNRPTASDTKIKEKRGICVIFFSRSSEDWLCGRHVDVMKSSYEGGNCIMIDRMVAGSSHFQHTSSRFSRQDLFSKFNFSNAYPKVDLIEARE